uniref:Uncharacterized protein n=1 Tax=Cacopsylla melanoneura TaxID=428564 RepID=A0A8D8YSE6_9HEMI
MIMEAAMRQRYKSPHRPVPTSLPQGARTLVTPRGQGAQAPHSLYVPRVAPAALESTFARKSCRKCFPRRLRSRTIPWRLRQGVTSGTRRHMRRPCWSTIITCHRLGAQEGEAGGRSSRRYTPIWAVHLKNLSRTPRTFFARPRWPAWSGPVSTPPSPIFPPSHYHPSFCLPPSSCTNQPMSHHNPNQHLPTTVTTLVQPPCQVSTSISRDQLQHRPTIATL